MKKRLALLILLLLLLSFVGCGKQTPTPEQPEGPDVPPVDEGIVLAELNVEFVAGDRDADALMQLKRELPPLLIGALAEQEVRVEKVNVTFGASSEATAEALARGTVQVGFVPTEAYLAHKDALLAVASPETPAENAEQVGLYLPLSEQNGAIRAEFEKNAANGGALQAWSALLGSFWTAEGLDPVFALPANDGVARRFLDSLMGIDHNGMTADSIPDLIEYTGADEAFSNAALVVLHGTETPDAGLWTEVYRAVLGGEVVAVSAADAIVSGDAFTTALSAALAELSADETAQAVLHLYNGAEVRYEAVDASAYGFAEYLLSDTEGIYALTTE